MEFRKDKLMFSCCNVKTPIVNKSFVTICPKCQKDYTNHPFFFMNGKRFEYLKVISKEELDFKRNKAYELLIP